MAAITVDTQRDETVGFCESGLPVKAGEKIPAGAIACVDSSGRALNGATTAGLKCAGVAREGFDNTDGADGVLTAFAESRVIRVQHGKAWLFAVAGSPAIGKPVYLVNNNDLTTVAGNVFVGVIVQHDGQGGTGWYVYIPGVAGPAGAQAGAIVDLTDSTGLSGTHNDTLSATTVPADITGGESPTEAEHNALLAVTRVIAQNASDTAQKVLEILAALRSAGIISA
jgi:hypothetical protein